MGKRAVIYSFALLLFLQAGYRYFFVLELDHYVMSKIDLDHYVSSENNQTEERTRTVDEERHVHYSRFASTLSDGANSSGPWTLPNTIFTPYISTLVDVFREDQQYCQNLSLSKPNKTKTKEQKGSTGSKEQKRHLSSSKPKPKESKAEKQARPKGPGGSFNVTVHSSTSVPVFTLTGKWLYYAQIMKKLFNAEGRRFLPPGHLALTFSSLDWNAANHRCSFANSSPGGRRAVFNFEDMRRWHDNQTSPASLPWERREPIPIFRGRLWLHRNYLKRMNETLNRNLQRGMSTAEAGEIFFEQALGQRNMSDAFASKSAEHNFKKRLNLVHFSKLHPELVDARLSNCKKCNNRDHQAMWAANVTNGMFRFLPFDDVPPEKFYTTYQTHVIMGGAGAAFRTARVLRQGIAVVLQQYPYEEFYYHLMVPFVHYIPLAQDLSNLSHTLQWVRDHPTQVREVARNGRLFYDEFLSYDRMGDFFHELLFRLMLCCGSNNTTL